MSKQKQNKNYTDFGFVIRKFEAVSTVNPAGCLQIDRIDISRRAGAEEQLKIGKA